MSHVLSIIFEVVGAIVTVGVFLAVVTVLAALVAEALVERRETPEWAIR